MREFAKIFKVGDNLVLVREEKDEQTEHELVIFTTFFEDLGYIDDRVKVTDSKVAMEKTTLVEAQKFINKILREFSHIIFSKKNLKSNMNIHNNTLQPGDTEF